MAHVTSSIWSALIRLVLQDQIEIVSGPNRDRVAVAERRKNTHDPPSGGRLKSRTTRGAGLVSATGSQPLGLHHDQSGTPHSVGFEGFVFEFGPGIPDVT